MKRLLFVVMITMFIPLLGCCGSRQQQEKVVYKPVYVPPAIQPNPCCPPTQPCAVPSQSPPTMYNGF